MTRSAENQVRAAIELLQRLAAVGAEPDIQRKQREALALLHAACDALQSLQTIERPRQRGVG